jgi:hypothetical protein
MKITSKRWDGVTCTLVNVKTGAPIENGAAIMLDGERVIVSGGRAPHKPGSTGRAWVQDPRTHAEREFFPGVIDAQWMPETITAPEDGETRFMPLI